jgi:hypothetical protein
MSTINPANNLQFKKNDALFARVRRRLRSFDNAGLLDEGDWYWYIKELLELLGVAVYDEREAVVMVKNYKGPLPNDFSFLYAAYKCTPVNNFSDIKNNIWPQTGFVFYIDETHEPYRQCKNCYSAKRDFIEGEKYTVRTYIQGEPTIMNFNEPRLLKLGAGAKSFCTKDCKNKNIFGTDMAEITLDKTTLYANFESDGVLIKYYAFPLDPETGLPLIPDHTILEKAVEDYIVYRTLSDIYLNSEAPDLENRLGLVRAEQEKSFGQAQFLTKLPSFQTVINKIRVDRNNLRIYFQM